MSKFDISFLEVFKRASMYGLEEQNAFLNGVAWALQQLEDRDSKKMDNYLSMLDIMSREDSKADPPLDDSYTNQEDYEAPKEAEPLNICTEKLTEKDEDGNSWYIRTSFSAEDPSIRVLHRGDAIVYKEYGSIPGFGIIGSFDFESDFVARFIIGASPRKKANEALSYKPSDNFVFYGDYTPSMERFRLATEKDIVTFFSDLKLSVSDAKYEQCKNELIDRFGDKYKKYL